MKEQNFDRAIVFYTKAINEDARDWAVYANRSKAYYELKKYQEALLDALKVIEI